jgi:hypothetical protein
MAAEIQIIACGYSAQCSEAWPIVRRHIAVIVDPERLVYLAPSMMRLRASNGLVRILIGSNDGVTQLADLERPCSPPPGRKNQALGIVNFDNAYFHTKTVHVTRNDRSAASRQHHADFSLKATERAVSVSMIC